MIKKIKHEILKCFINFYYQNKVFFRKLIYIITGILYNFYGRYYMKKIYVNEMIRNNQFLNESKEKIEKVINENLEYRRKYSIWLYFTFFALFLIFPLSVYLFIHEKFGLFFVPFIAAIICYIIIIVINGTYKSRFKKDVIKKIINIYNSDLVYCTESNVNGFGSSEYIACKFPFPDKCDRFFSEDLIISKKSNFKFSDILVQKVLGSRSDSGIVSYYGALSKIDITDVGCNIFLDANNKKNRRENNNIKFDNEEFNRLFLVYSDDESLTKKVLSSHVIEQIVNLKKSIYDDIDIRMLHDKLYIRYSSGDSFVPSLWNRKKEKNSIIQSIAVLEIAIKTMNTLKLLIDNKKQ